MCPVGTLKGVTLRLRIKVLDLVSYDHIPFLLMRVDQGRDNALTSCLRVFLCAWAQTDLCR